MYFRIFNIEFRIKELKKHYSFGSFGVVDAKNKKEAVDKFYNCDINKKFYKLTKERLSSMVLEMWL